MRMCLYMYTPLKQMHMSMTSNDCVKWPFHDEIFTDLYLIGPPVNGFKSTCMVPHTTFYMAFSLPSGSETDHKDVLQASAV